MPRTPSTLLSLPILLAALAAPSLASAQSNPGYFVPPQQQPRPAPRAPAQRPQAPRPLPTVQPMPPDPGPGPGPDAAQQTVTEDQSGPQMQLQLPPMPALPAMTKGTAPPAAVIGVLGIPEIMRASTAAQQVEKIVGERRERLNQDAQKEQLVWREMQQSLANERSKLNPDQIRAREKELQDRITNAQKTFRTRNQTIQEAGQYGLAQIERVLVAVIRQVAESRGMNLVMHRAQVALNVNEFDITDQVVEQLNKTLPSVSLPQEGVRPPMAEIKPDAAAPGATPVSAPPGGAPQGGGAPQTRPAGGAPTKP